MKNRFFKFLSIFLAEFIVFPLFAETVLLQIEDKSLGFSDNVSFQFEWNEKWFGEKSPTIYNHGLSRIACALATVSYVNEEADPNFNIIKNVYRKLGVPDRTMEFHYDLDYNAPGAEMNQAAFSIASKEINSAKGKQTLVFLTIRGTPLSAPEWISNIDVADSTHQNVAIHEGFFRTQNLIQNALIYYLLKHKIDPDTTYFLITGHSRGAALSNLLAAELADEGYFKTENMYVYTFASPNVSQEERVNNPKYNFIWNIINPEDIAPIVPMRRLDKKENWNFSKFGQMKVFANYWNTDKNLYENDYLPRINKYFSQMQNRDYMPFATGTYIPSTITKLLTDLYPSLNDYYDSAINLRYRGEKIFYKIFPEEETTNSSNLENASDSNETNDSSEENALSQEEKDDIKENKLFSTAANYIDRKTNGFLDFATYAFSDMHACATYLSYVLALDENEAFCDEQSSRIIIKGAYECAIFDSEGNVALRITDGIPVFETMQLPVIAVPFPSGTIIGFPSSQNYSVVVYKDSLLPTPIPLKIEHYDSASYLFESFDKKYIYPHKGTSYSFNIGKETLTESEIPSHKNNLQTTKALVKAGNLKTREMFKIQPEISLDIDGAFEGGVRIGSRMIHGTILISEPFSDFGNSINLNLGIGHEETLISRTLLDFSAFGKFSWVFSDLKNDDNLFNFVPQARISLVYRPIKRISLFAAGTFDFHIENFNDSAFYENVRDNVLGHFSLGEYVDVYPSLRFGLRFYAN